MAETKRSLVARGATFLQFLSSQRRAAASRAAGLSHADPQAPLQINGGEDGWTSTGLKVSRGQAFRVEAQGHLWLAKPLGLVVDPCSTIYLRIGGRGLRKLIADDAVYEAWGDGEVEVLSKGLSEFADEDGALLPGRRAKQPGGISLRLTASDAAASPTGQPADWRYLWRIGDGRIYTGDPDDIAVSTQGDVGILQREVDVALTEQTELSWDWLVDQLPSALPEDLAFTHDYLSIAVEFDNGRDLTWMWSAGLPHDHVFRCPLGWWCDRETHWVLRSGSQGLGQWHSERRKVLADYRAALGDPLPQRIVRIWLIANSVFQRRHGKARFAKIRLG